MGNTKRKTLFKVLLILGLTIILGLALSLAMLNQSSITTVNAVQQQEELFLDETASKKMNINLEDIIEMYQHGKIDSFEAQHLHEEYTRRNVRFYSRVHDAVASTQSFNSSTILYGQIEWEDRGGLDIFPLRNVRVELWYRNIVPLSYHRLKTTYTDSEGFYSFSWEFGWFGVGSNVVIRVFAASQTFSVVCPFVFFNSDIGYWGITRHIVSENQNCILLVTMPLQMPQYKGFICTAET